MWQWLTSPLESDLPHRQWSNRGSPAVHLSLLVLFFSWSHLVATLPPPSSRIVSVSSRRCRPELLAMLEAATAAIGGPSTDAASACEVEAAEAAAATAVATGTPTSCSTCVGQASGCGGGGCELTTGSGGGSGSSPPGLPLGLALAAQAETCQPPGWSSVHCTRVCLR